MAVVLKHPFNSPKADGTDSTLVQPSNWNAAHTLTATAGNVLGTPVGSTTVSELPLAFDATLQSMIPPTGTTAQRPATAVAGMLRYNSTTSKFELFNGAAWGSVGGGAAVSSSAPANASTGDLWYDTTNALLKYYDGSAWQITSASNTIVQNFSGNASTTVFTLSDTPSSKNVTSVFISGVYQAKGNYSLSGTTLTFGTAPPSGTNNIEINWTNSTPIGTPGDGTVATVKLADSAVTTVKLSDLSVTTAKVVDLAVTTAKVNDRAVTYAKMQNVSNDTIVLGRITTGGGIVEEIPFSSIVTTANALAATAGATAGAVGTYVWAYTGAAATANSTYAGSGLRYSGSTGDSGTSGNGGLNHVGGATLSGTWKAMGTMSATTSAATLFLRIS